MDRHAELGLSGQRTDQESFHSAYSFNKFKTVTSNFLEQQSYKENFWFKIVLMNILWTRQTGLTKSQNLTKGFPMTSRDSTHHCTYCLFLNNEKHLSQSVNAISEKISGIPEQTNNFYPRTLRIRTDFYCSCLRSPQEHREKSQSITI